MILMMNPIHTHMFYSFYMNNLHLLTTGQSPTNKQEESYFFQVVGQAKSQIMYLEGCDPLQPPVLSLACLPKPLEDEETPGNLCISCLQ